MDRRVESTSFSERGCVENVSIDNLVKYFPRQSLFVLFALPTVLGCDGVRDGQPSLEGKQCGQPTFCFLRVDLPPERVVARRGLGYS